MSTCTQTFADRYFSISTQNEMAAASLCGLWLILRRTYMDTETETERTYIPGRKTSALYCCGFSWWTLYLPGAAQSAHKLFPGTSKISSIDDADDVIIAPCCRVLHVMERTLPSNKLHHWPVMSDRINLSNRFIFIYALAVHHFKSATMSYITSASRKFSCSLSVDLVGAQYFADSRKIVVDLKPQANDLNREPSFNKISR